MLAALHHLVLALLLCPVADAACAAACAAGRYCATTSCSTCPLGFTCAGGLTAQPAACVPFSACPATGLSAQLPCAWGVVNYVGSGAAGNGDSWWPSATLSAPAGVATWPNTLNGFVVIASGNAIRNATGSKVYTLVGSTAGSSGLAAGAGTSVLLNGPTRMAAASGTPLYVADTGNNVLRTVACACCVCVCARVCVRACVCGLCARAGANDDLNRIAAFFMNMLVTC
jgi:hypothetical protein